MTEVMSNSLNSDTFSNFDTSALFSVLNYLTTNDNQEIVSLNDNSCKHINTTEDGSTTLCEDCGVEILRNDIFENNSQYKATDPKRCHPGYGRKIVDKNIFKDVQNMGFSEEIITQANNLFRELTKDKICRSDSRKSIIFACIYHSYKIQGKPKTCDNLIKVFGIDKKLGIRGLKYISNNTPKESSIRLTRITATDIIEEILKGFNISEDQRLEVQALYEKIRNKSTILNGSRPHSLAASIIWTWIKLKGKNITLKEYVKRVNLSELTINKITKEIEKNLGITK